MKTVLVTGGTTRIGLAIAERLRADGWRVLTSSHRADAGADIVADLAEPMGPAKLYAEALRLLDGEPPDALVNNAALFVGDAPILEAINLTAPKKLTRLMAGRETPGRGAVVNLLDTRVMGTDPERMGTDPASEGGEDAYSRTKAALVRETVESAQLFADTLRVNGVAPGPVLAPVEAHEKAGELLVDRPTPADVAVAVAYLLTAPSTTGCIIPVDGGQHLLGDRP